MAVDNWEHILNLVTGWTLPERSEITGAKGDSGIPWMNVHIKEIGNSLSPTNTLADMGATFQFYVAKGFSVGMYQAEVTYADISPGKQFWTRSDFALWHLLNNHTTVGLTDPVGGGPSGTGGVDMHSFSKAAASFDAAGAFFANRTEILKQWLESLGDEQAAWKGTAAGVFWHLLDDLHNKYENFTSELRPPGFQPQNHSLANPSYQTTTLHGDSLIGAELSLHAAIQKLYDQYFKFFWQQGESVSYTKADGSTASEKLPADPRDIMNQMMADVANWIKDHNWNHVTYQSGGVGYNGNGTAPIWSTTSGFSANPTWGNLQDTSTWSAIANEAVRRWTTNVQTNLDTPAVPVVTELQQNWTRVLDPNWNTRFAFEDTPSVNLQQIYQQDVLDKKQADADAKQKDIEGQNKKAQEDLNAQNKNFQSGLENFGKNISDFGNNLDNFGNDLTNIPPPTLPDGANLGGANGVTGGDDLKNLLDTGGGAQSITSLPDGTTLGPDGLPLTGGDSLPGSGGPTTTMGPDGMPLTTFPGGSTQTLTAGGLPLRTNPDGSRTTSNPDGSVTTQFPDGSSTTVNPDGTVTTTSPQGLTDVSHLDPGDVVTNPDGSTTGIGPNGGVVTHMPDGTTVSTNPDGSVTTTSPDGSVSTQFPNGATQTLGPDGTIEVTNPDGSVTTPGSDGSLSRSYPDGSSTVVAPDGTVTTTTPDGQTQVSHLDAGEVVTNPDGSTTGVDPDGGVTTHMPDGSSLTAHPDGSLTTTNADGSRTTQFPNGVTQSVGADGQVHITGPDGSFTTQNADGGTTTSFPNGSTSTVNPDGTVTTTTPDGQTISSQLGPGESLVNPDGSTTTLGPDGDITTTMPDGGSFTLHPDGTVTTTNPTGADGLGGLSHPPTSSNGLHTPDLSGLKSDLNHALATHGPDGSLTTHFPSGATATTGPDGLTTTTFPDGSSSVAGPNGEFQALPSPATAAAGGGGAAGGGFGGNGLGVGGLGGGLGAGAGADPGLMGMMSPMMMMMGMARMGQQGGQQSGGQDRVREVYEDSDSDGAFLQHPRLPQQSTAPAEDTFEEEEEDTQSPLSRSRTDSGHGGRGGVARPATQSGWSDGDGDVWGTEEGGLPASIGR